MTMKQKPNPSQKTTKTYPFDKSLFVNRYKKPMFIIRLLNLCIGMKAGIEGFCHPVMDNYNHYPLVYIWGNLNGGLLGHDDICIIYNLKEKMYYCKVETAICADVEGYAKYLDFTLECFTNFMEAAQLDMDAPKILMHNEPKIELKAPSIEQLYTEYTLFVNAYIYTYAPFEEEFSDEDEDEDGDEECSKA